MPLPPMRGNDARAPPCPETLMPLPRLAAPVLLAMTLPLLARCGTKADEFPPACPRADLVWEAADLTRYNDATAAANQDVRGLVLSGRFVGIPAKCQTGSRPTEVTADVGVTIQLTRGPAMQGRAIDVPFFLAVTQGDRILDKQNYQAHIVFPPNVDNFTYNSESVHMVFPVDATKSAAVYTVLAGFQLTPGELAYNRAHPRPRQ
jgi:hypothetical protein